MLEKKLVTLMCAVGILACGGCFLPPLPEHRPPPPPQPLEIDLQGVHDIRVHVTNVSESHHLDPSELAEAVANRINEQAWRTRVNARIDKEPGYGDAVLEIAIVSENATPGTAAGNDGPGKVWFFQVKTTSTLAKLNGAVLWTESDGGPGFSRKLASQDAADVWTDPAVSHPLILAVGNRLVYRMVYVH